MVACNGPTKLVAKGVILQDAPVSMITGHSAASAAVYPLGDDGYARDDGQDHVDVTKLARKHMLVVRKRNEHQHRDGEVCNV
eukprot:489795-Ditylum_brightwellii.AAC.1